MGIETGNSDPFADRKNPKLLCGETLNADIMSDRTSLLNACMGFWKSIFSSPETASTPKAVSLEEYAAIGVDPRTGAQTKVYFSTDRNIDLYELEELCDAVGWARRPIRKVKKAIEYSFIVVSMWEVRGTRRRLIGFARATSDRAFNATVWDVVVHPEFQGKGLGKGLMKYLIKKLRSYDISNITLFADPQVVEFYRSLGFLSDPEGIKGMFWYPS
jgi:aralkylamine N-acetyltransferase